MQTFLPVDDFASCAKILDFKRLNRQIREAKQILCVLMSDQPERKKRNRKWGNFYPRHPAVLMWRGYHLALVKYIEAMIFEFKKRGGQDNVDVSGWLDRVKSLLKCWSYSEDDPPWLGNEKLHTSHRSNLLRKDNSWYSKFNWKEGNGLPYWWPTHHGF